MDGQGLQNKREFVRVFGRHFVSLACVHRAVGDRDERFDLTKRCVDISGFIVSVHGEWFWITAGHIFDEFCELLRKANRQVSYCRFVDAWGFNPAYTDPIPVEFDQLRKAKLGDFDGIDCVIMPLSQNYKDLLLRNSIEPLDEKAWVSIPRRESIDQFLLVGIPTELVHRQSCKQGTLVNNWPTCICYDVEPLDTDSDKMNTKTFPRIRGRIQRCSQPPLKSIEGMSGGPLFAIRHTEAGLKYWLIGIQSGWFPDSHEIQACPIQGILVSLRRVLDKVMGRQQEAVHSTSS